MALSLKQYDALISKLDRFAKRNPKAYRFQVIALAALGYGYILFVLIVALALTVGIAILFVIGHSSIALVKPALFCGALVWLILKSLVVKFPKPEGIPLTRADQPALYAMIDSIAAKLNAPRLHHVLLNDEFNAAIAQCPRLGVFGWQTNYLILGLPLMQALTPEQFESVVAHEFGHLSGNHGRFGGWVYRIRKTWSNILTQTEARRGRGEFALKPFVEWYVPYFNAYSFVLARMDEYMADKCSAELVGAQTAAQALIAGRVRAMMLQDAYNSTLRAETAALPEPPIGVTGLIYASLRTAPPADQSSHWLGDALQENTDNADTHPSLRDRLGALKFPVDAGSYPRQPVTRSAADDLLAASLPRLSEQMDHYWRASRAEGWRRRHERLKVLSEAVDVAAAGEADGTLTARQAKQRAFSMLELGASVDAIPYLQQAAQLAPNDADLQYALGRAMLENGDVSGEARLLRAAEIEPKAALQAAEILQAFWERRGDRERAAAYQERRYAEHDIAVAARREREGYKPGDAVIPHGLSASEIEPITALLSSDKSISEAILVRKSLRHHADSEPYYVLQMVAFNGWLTFDAKGKRRLLLDRVQKQGQGLWPGQTWLRVTDGRERSLKRIRRDVPGAIIYKRPKR